MPLDSHHPRDMVLRDVRDLVTQDTNQFRFTLGAENQAGVYTDITTRKRERIDGFVLDREELEVPARIGAVGNQHKTDLVQVVGHVRIIKVPRARANLAHDRIADHQFLSRRQDRL